MFSIYLKLLRSTDLFCRDLKTFLFHSVYGTKIRIDSVMRPQSSSRGAHYKCLSYSYRVRLVSTVARFGEKMAIGLLLVACTLKFGFGAMLLYGILYETLASGDRFG